MTQSQVQPKTNLQSAADKEVVRTQSQRDEGRLLGGGGLRTFLWLDQEFAEW